MMEFEEDYRLAFNQFLQFQQRYRNENTLIFSIEAIHTFDDFLNSVQPFIQALLAATWDNGPDPLWPAELPNAADALHMVVNRSQVPFSVPRTIDAHGISRLLRYGDALKRVVATIPCYGIKLFVNIYIRGLYDDVIRIPIFQSNTMEVVLPKALGHQTFYNFEVQLLQPEIPLEPINHIIVGEVYYQCNNRRSYWKEQHCRIGQIFV